MKTKQQILSDNGFHISPGMEDIEMMISNIEDAMEEYAKQRLELEKVLMECYLTGWIQQNEIFITELEKLLKHD